MNILFRLSLLFSFVLSAVGADVTMSSFPTATSPSTNTFVPIIDLNNPVATQNEKYLLTNLTTEAEFKNGTNFGRIYSDTKQAGSANLTNWSALSTNLIGSSAPVGTVVATGTNAAGMMLTATDDKGTNGMWSDPIWTNKPGRVVLSVKTNQVVMGTEFIDSTPGLLNIGAHRDTVSANPTVAIYSDTLVPGFAGYPILYVENDGSSDAGSIGWFYNQNGVFGIEAYSFAPNGSYAEAAVFAGVQGGSTNQAGLIASANPSFDGQVSVGSGGSVKGIGAFNGTFVGGYHEVKTETFGTVPVFESSILLLDNRDSGLPLVVGRTNNGTRVFKIDSDGSISAGTTNRWKTGDYFTNYVGLDVNGNATRLVAEDNSGNVTIPGTLNVNTSTFTNFTATHLTVSDITESNKLVSTSPTTTALTNGYYAAVTNTLGYAPVNRAGDTMTGALLSTSATTNGPAANELATAGWVRNLLVTGQILYNSGDTNASGFDNPTFAYVSVIPTNGSRTYLSAVATNGAYIGSVMTTNTYQSLGGDVVVSPYICSINGNAASGYTLHAEVYITYDRTNLLGDWESGVETIVHGVTNKYSFVVPVPQTVSTNTAGFYLVRRLKINAKTGSGDDIMLHYGTNFPSSISIPNVAGLVNNGNIPTANIGTGTVTNNLSVALASGITNYIDFTYATRTNAIGVPITFSFATNGLTGYELSHTRYFLNTGGSNLTLTIPSGWKTNMAQTVCAALTNGVTTVMYVKAIGDTSSSALQTNVYVSFEYYK